MAKRPKQLIPKAHLSAIGAVAVNWTALENLMEQTILGLYEIDLGRGLVFTANLSFHSRLSMLRFLAGDDGVIKDAALAKQTNDLLNEIDKAFGDRNFIIHGSWFPVKDKPGHVHRMSVRARGKKLQTFSRHYSAADLQRVADRIGDLVGDLFDIAERLDIRRRLAAAPKHSSSASQ
ncbi:MAG: hypothetical protein KGJ66_03280 [Alphaproteobacteria bacterium]|nr:hypothetical protein [Alphaproteobacteria bacterium]